MKLLIVTNHFYPESFRVNDIAFWMAERGHEVTVVTGAPNYPDGRIFEGYGQLRRARERVRGVEVVRMPLVPRGRGRGWELALNYASHAASACALAPLRLRGDYDVAFVFDTSPVTVALSAILMKRLRGIPMVMWMLDLWPESLEAAGGVRSPAVLGAVRRLVRFIYSQCDLLLVSSRGFEQQVKEVGGYTGEVVYFPNWVEDVYLTEPTPEPALGPDDPFVVLFAGNVGEAQSFGTILEAAALAKRARGEGEPRILWRVVGDGRALPWVREEIGRRNLDDDFELVGRVPAAEMPRHFANAHALLVTLTANPAFARTAPGKLQSYLAAGRPILAALNGEGARIVEEAGAGVAVAAEDAVGLAAAVGRLRQWGGTERAHAGIAGSAYCKRNFSKEGLIDALERSLLSLAGQAHSARRAHAALSGAPATAVDGSRP